MNSPKKVTGYQESPACKKTGDYSRSRLFLATSIGFLGVAGGKIVDFGILGKV